VADGRETLVAAAHYVEGKYVLLVPVLSKSASLVFIADKMLRPLCLLDGIIRLHAHVLPCNGTRTREPKTVTGSKGGAHSWSDACTGLPLS
jgi:hypothetical protein